VASLKFSKDNWDSLISGRTRGIGPTILRSALWAASVPYSYAVRLRNRLYDRPSGRRIRVGIPVVSVGNLTLGGTGKTPCVEYVSRFYRRHGIRVTILSRGYGGDGGRNDEAFVLEENLPDVPHLQGRDRVSLARTAIEGLKAELLVLDDGFQHRRLDRDLDLVLLDATNPWGNGHLFPRGFLREPASSLRRAGLIVLTHCDQVHREACAELRRWISCRMPDVPLVETTHCPLELRNNEQVTTALEPLVRGPVAAFCGIGNPENFRKTLMSLGARLQAFRVYPDHHAYTRGDVEDLHEWAATQAEDCIVVTTQKDEVKLRLSDLGGRPLWALRIGLHIEAGREELERKLRSLLPALRDPEEGLKIENSELQNANLDS
jgi:tetraacyldisaccharide 4'-kinase